MFWVRFLTHAFGRNTTCLSSHQNAYWGLNTLNSGRTADHIYLFTRKDNSWLGSRMFSNAATPTFKGKHLLQGYFLRGLLLIVMWPVWTLLEKQTCPHCRSCRASLERFFFSEDFNEPDLTTPKYPLRNATARLLTWLKQRSSAAQVLQSLKEFISVHKCPDVYSYNIFKINQTAELEMRTLLATDTASAVDQKVIEHRTE